MSHAGEPLKIDKTTYNIIGAKTGAVYGSGTGDTSEAKLSSALALQTQLASGGTPTVAGRPDLYALAPTAAEGTPQAITGANGKPVMPTVATPEQLAEQRAGTLTSFNKATGGVPPAPATATPVAPTAPPQPPTNFADAMQATLKAGANAKKDELLGAPDSYDNQILRQKAAMMSKMFGQDLTPDDLKWLTPAQSGAVLSGDEKLIKSELAALNTITTGRKSMRDEADAKARQAEKDSFTRLSTLKDLGLLGTLSPEAAQKLSEQTGLDLASVNKLVADAKESGGADWKLDTDANGNLIKYAFDPSTGAYKEEIIKKGAGSDADVKKLESFQNDAAAIVGKLGTGDLEWGTAWDQLHVQYPDVPNEILDGILSGGLNAEADSKAEQIDSGKLSWGDAWNQLHENYPYVPNSVIDEMLGGGQDPVTESWYGRAQDFKSVGSDTNKGAEGAGTKGTQVVRAITAAYQPGEFGKQCGAFVNRLTGLGVGNSYQSKLAKCTISSPSNAQAGDVFVMPYKDTGHIGFVVSKGPRLPDGSFDMKVIDSNWHLDERVDIHTINSKKMTAFARAPLKTNFPKNLS